MELALLVMLLMCSDHERLFVIVTLRYFVLLDCWMTDPHAYIHTHLQVHMDTNTHTH